ncbi:MAG: AAA family ATPase [Ignavibacteriales bacterium]|nr:AAA family ATPase [Ignavibacteriales bacterium]
MKSEIVPAHNAIKLTLAQQETFTTIAGFFNSETPCYILKGYAGTGKTFLIRILSRYLKTLNRQFFLIAPTGRAARILATKSGFTATTIHSLIYGEAKESTTLEDGKEAVSLKFNLKSNQHAANALYIIDEASMLSDREGSSEFLSFGSGRLLKDFFRHIGLSEDAKTQMPDRKVIIVGDPAQMPPVQQEESVALDAGYLFNEYGIDSKEFELTEIIRQKADNRALLLASGIREAMNKSELTVNAFQLALDHEVSESRMMQIWKDLIQSISEEEIILIVSTNKYASYYNTMLRRLKYRQANLPLQVKDRLLVTNNNRLFGLLNGDIVDVVSINHPPETHTIPTYSGRDVTFSFRDIVVGYKNEFGEYEHQSVKILENLLWSQSPSLAGEEWQALKAAAIKIHGLVAPDQKMKKKKPTEYKELAEKYKEELNASPYMNAVQVKYGYAITCHKAQGGEWQHVFLDFRSFSSLDSIEYFRWAYTAITRTKEALYALHLPPGLQSEPQRYFYE